MDTLHNTTTYRDFTIQIWHTVELVPACYYATVTKTSDLGTQLRLGRTPEFSGLAAAECAAKQMIDAKVKPDPSETMDIHEALGKLDLSDPAQARVARYVKEAQRKLEESAATFWWNAQRNTGRVATADETMRPFHEGMAAAYEHAARIIDAKSEALDGRERPATSG